MDQETALRLSGELQRLLNGDSDHDRAVLLDWAERYRGNADARPLLREIGLLLFQLDAGTAGALTGQVMDELARRNEETLSRALEELAGGEFARAEGLLAPAVAELDSVSLPEEGLWMDFNSFLDGLLYQDYFREEIGEREIRRHPLHPGKLLYAYAAALMGQEKSREAMEVLERLAELDPVCPEYLCALADACLGVRRIGDAWETLCWALICASTPEEAAYCYYLLSRCCAAGKKWADAAVLLQKSIRVTPLPETERVRSRIVEWAGKGTDLSDAAVNRRCRDLGVPTGRSKAVEENLAFLSSLSS